MSVEETTCVTCGATFLAHGTVDKDLGWYTLAEKCERCREGTRYTLTFEVVTLEPLTAFKRDDWQEMFGDDTYVLKQEIKER